MWDIPWRRDFSIMLMLFWKDNGRQRASRPVVVQVCGGLGVWVKKQQEFVCLSCDFTITQPPHATTPHPSVAPTVLCWLTCGLLQSVRVSRWRAIYAACPLPTADVSESVRPHVLIGLLFLNHEGILWEICHQSGHAVQLCCAGPTVPPHRL